jgi:hypothetical protein
MTGSAKFEICFSAEIANQVYISSASRVKKLTSPGLLQTRKPENAIFKAIQSQIKAIHQNTVAFLNPQLILSGKCCFWFYSRISTHALNRIWQDLLDEKLEF